MKKILTGIILTLICAFSVFASDVTVKLDGKELEFEQPAVIVEERTLVPLRGIFEALGATVSWDDATKTVTSVKDDVTIKLTIGDKVLYKNGNAHYELDVPAQIMGEGYTMVPVRAISESFGVNVDWDDATKTVILKTPKKQIEGAIISYADAEDPENFYGLYSSGAKPLHTVPDPLVEGNNVYFLDATVTSAASWTYLWVKTNFIPGCQYLIEYDVMIGDDVFGNKVEKSTVGTCFSYAANGETKAKQNGIGSTIVTAGQWKRVSQTYVVPEDYNTDVGCSFGVFASPVTREGYSHKVAIDYYIDNIVVVPFENALGGVIPLSEAKIESVYFDGSTTKNPLEYAPGETMTFKLSVKSGKDTVTVPYIYYTCTGEDGKKTQGYVSASEDGFFYFDTKCERDGFVKVKAQICNENKNVLSSYQPFEGGAGVEIDKIKCDTPEPDDYLEFWESLKKTAFALKNEVIYEKDISTNADFVSKDIRLKTAEGAGEYASFVVTYPKNATPGSLKLRMDFMSYGVDKAVPNYISGYMVISMNSHDLPNDLPNEEYTNIRNTTLKDYGWIKSENQKPETSYWWKMFVRNMQVYNYAINHELFNGDYVEFRGGSQGGFQACNMAAHVDKVSFCYMDRPWFGNIAGTVMNERADGWYPDPDAGVCYFDTAIAAKYVKCKTEISAGLGDFTCPPSSIMAIYNNLSCEKLLTFLQNRTHTYIAPNYSKYVIPGK